MHLARYHAFWADLDIIGKQKKGSLTVTHGTVTSEGERSLNALGYK